jgi:hypothetical protein
MNLKREGYNALLGADFYPFTERSFRQLNPATELLRNWHLEMIAAKLDACCRGQLRRLIINVPPLTSNRIAHRSPSRPGSWATIRPVRSCA